jgi:hypothetical protein
MQQSRQQRIGQHRHRPEHGHAGDRVDDVFIRGVGHGVGGDDGGGAANGSSGRDQLRELAVDPKQLAHPDRKGERRQQRRCDDADTAAADFDHLGNRQLQPEQDDGDPQQTPQAEGDARPRDGWCADQIVNRDADQDGEDHRAERGHARQLPQSIGRRRHNRSQQQARQDRERRLTMRRNGEVGVRNERRCEGGHGLGSIGFANPISACSIDQSNR